MNLQAFDLNLLPVFEALIEERNVTRAARRIGLSQSAMSNALARLRRTFNDPLFVRSLDGMTPTPLAQSLIVPVRAALAQLRAAFEEDAAFDPSESEYTFHLLANDYAEMMLVAPLLTDMSSQAGGVSLHIYRPRNLFQPPPSTALADSFDLAIGFFPDALSLDSSLHSELLWEEHNVCIARNKHPVIRGHLSLQQYAEAQHVAVFYKSQGPGLIDSLLEHRRLSRRLTVLVPHFASVPSMVAMSDLIATVPDRLARYFSKLKLQIMPVPLEIPPFRLSMLWHERFDGDPAHIWLRQLITRTAAKLNR